MSGVRGALDDAQEVADRASVATSELVDTLTDALALTDGTEPLMVFSGLHELLDLAGQLRSRAGQLVYLIDQQRHALRRG